MHKFVRTMEEASDVILNILGEEKSEMEMERVQRRVTIIDNNISIYFNSNCVIHEYFC